MMSIINEFMSYPYPSSLPTEMSQNGAFLLEVQSLNGARVFIDNPFFAPNLTHAMSIEQLSTCVTSFTFDALLLGGIHRAPTAQLQWMFNSVGCDLTVYSK